MARVDQELDKLRTAKAAAGLAHPTPLGADTHEAVGAPEHLRPGAVVTDPVTGKEAVVVGYTRTVIRHQAAER
jgi:hypothetical protein